MAKYEPKTKVTKASVKDFLNAVENETRREDAFTMLKMMEKVTGEKAKMWGGSIVGFGTYEYETKGCKGEWMMTGFSPRKANLAIYIMPGFKEWPEIVKKLGKCKTSVSCLYINKLADVDLKALEKLIAEGYKFMQTKYKHC